MEKEPIVPDYIKREMKEAIEKADGLGHSFGEWKWDGYFLLEDPVRDAELFRSSLGSAKWRSWRNCAYEDRLDETI